MFEKRANFVIDCTNFIVDTFDHVIPKAKIHQTLRHRIELSIHSTAQCFSFILNSNSICHAMAIKTDNWKKNEEFHSRKSPFRQTRTMGVYRVIEIPFIKHSGLGLNEKNSSMETFFFFFSSIEWEKTLIDWIRETLFLFRLHNFEPSKLKRWSTTRRRRRRRSEQNSTTFFKFFLLCYFAKNGNKKK